MQSLAQILIFLTNLAGNKNEKAKENFADNHFHNSLRLFDVSENFHSPEVKRWAIITYKHGIYELPHELPNDLRLRILGN